MRYDCIDADTEAGLDYPVLERVLDNGLRVIIDELGQGWRPPL